MTKAERARAAGRHTSTETPLHLSAGDRPVAAVFIFFAERHYLPELAAVARIVL